MATVVVKVLVPVVLIKVATIVDTVLVLVEVAVDVLRTRGKLVEQKDVAAGTLDRGRNARYGILVHTPVAACAKPVKPKVASCRFVISIFEIVNTRWMEAPLCDYIQVLQLAAQHIRTIGTSSLRHGRSSIDGLA